MGKDKKEKRKSEGGEEQGPSYEDLLTGLNPIANPVANRKLNKKLLKCTKKATGIKGRHIRRGVKDVQKAIRKGETGILILAGDIVPVDVYCHLPALCEEKDIPYCYTPSKVELGVACGSKKSTSAVLLKSLDDYKDLYEEVSSEMKSLPMPC